MRLAAVAALALVATACGGRQAAAPALPSRPAPANPATARLVAADGSGARRLSLWLARNGAGDLCPGWRLGAGRPRRFHCQRRGLERPVLWVQGGGGAGNGVDWGSDVGLVAPGVARVVLDDRRAALRPAVGGWRSFAVGRGRPASALEAYGRGGTKLLEDDGLWIQPDTGTRTTAGWQGTYGYVPEQQRGEDATAVDLALAVPGVRKLVATRRAWIDRPVGWQKCAGGRIGEAVDIRFWRAASFRATLPFERTGVPGTKAPYVSGERQVLAIGSRGLYVWVDLNTRRAVGVDTAFDGGTELPLLVTKAAKPGGGHDDPSACPQGD